LQHFRIVPLSTEQHAADSRTSIPRPHSSQALCVSLFETIGLRAPAKRDAILADLFERAGLRLGAVSGATIETEVRDHRDVLNE
jgi:hypothetical protein